MKESINKEMDIILKKMCEFAELDYLKVNFTDDSHLKLRYKTKNKYNEFTEWLGNYLYGLKVSELRNILQYPHLCYRRKKMCKKFATQFNAWYGFIEHKEDKLW